MDLQAAIKKIYITGEIWNEIQGKPQLEIPLTVQRKYSYY